MPQLARSNADIRVAVPALPTPPSAAVLGADVAARRLLESVQRHASEVTIVGTRSEFDVVHDVRPSGDPRRHFRLRHARRQNTPIVLSLHALCYPWYTEAFFEPLLWSRAASFDAVVCSSAAARDACKRLLELAAGALSERGAEPPEFKAQFPVVPFGVDTDVYRPRHKAEVRHQLGLPVNAFVFLWVGRLSPRSKADLLPLLTAHAEVLSRNRDRQPLLVLAGSDPEGYAVLLEEAARDLGIATVVMVVRTDAATPMEYWYSAADAFVFPVDNLQESFGVAVIEAMASGLPQIVADWSGCRETVVHHQTGLHVPTYWASCDAAAVDSWSMHGDWDQAADVLAKTVACDVRTLVSHMEVLLTNDDLRAAMSAASRARALATYDWSVVVQQYVSLWAALREEGQRAATPLAAPAGSTPAFFAAFSGYASHLLTGATNVELPNGELDLPERADTDSGQPALERVLRVVAAAGGRLTCGELEVHGGILGLTEAEVRAAILLGIKYGLLSVP